MARDKKSLSDPFEEFSKDKKSEETVNSNTETVTEDVIQSKDGNITVEDVKRQLMTSYEEKANKKTVEETHTRSTFLFENRLSSRLDKLAKKKKRGFKTMFINKAIEALLDEME